MYRKKSIEVPGRQAAGAASLQGAGWRGALSIPATRATALRAPALSAAGRGVPWLVYHAAYGSHNAGTIVPAYPPSPSPTLKIKHQYIRLKLGQLVYFNVFSLNISIFLDRKSVV